MRHTVTKAGRGAAIYNKLFVIKHAFLVTRWPTVALQQDAHGLNEPG